MRLAGLLLVVIIVMSGIGYWYYTDTQARMAILQENNAKLEIAVQTNEAALESLQVDYASAQLELTNLNEEYTSIRRQNQQLANKLQAIDLTAAAISNAEGIQRAVNRGTANAGRCFELLSGSPLTEEEKNAENEIAFNKECPWLWPGPSPDSMRNSTTKN
jgi:chromosome segregation ATPase|tara:strand:- start:7443 stop:7925 length:483 start_codon:yes stop_codon:yes gene_type:complete